MLTQRKKVVLAGFASVLLHALIFVAAVFIIGLTPQGTPTPVPKPVVIEIVKSDPVLTATPAPTPARHVVDNSRMAAASQPPVEAKLEGERDTVASSEGPANGDRPLPTQQGRSAPNYVFDPSPPVPPAPPSQPASPALAQASTAPAPPQPTRSVLRPPVEEGAPILVRNEVTMLDTQPTPPPDEINPYDPSFRSTAPPLPVPERALRKPAVAYRPMEEQTASNGNITNRGTGGVDAVATPYGRYRKKICAALWIVWNDSLHAHSDLASLGEVKLHFAVDRTGHVHTARILSNSANEALASITLDTVEHTPIPPIPPDVIETMDSAMLQLDVTFECL